MDNHDWIFMTQLCPLFIASLGITHNSNGSIMKSWLNYILSLVLARPCFNLFPYQISKIYILIRFYFIAKCENIEIYSPKK